MTATTADNVLDRFEAGEDVLDYFNGEPEVEEPDPDAPHPLNLVPPNWLVAYYDGEARRRGISRRAMLNNALVDWAEQNQERQARLKQGV